MRMEMRRDDEQLGTPWVIAILVLVALLIMGIVIYLRMSVRMRHPGQHRAVTQPEVSKTVTYFRSTQHWIRRDWV